MHVGLILADRYEIVRPLAEGAMSTVWVAHDRSTQQDVAIKAISLDAAGWRSEVRDRFMKEARLLARGTHEHLVGVHDVGETEDGFLYLVLDLLDGETLAARLARENKLEWREATSLALGITRGVAALHRAGIVHRDLKPANIVLRRTNGSIVPTIIDLGIGKAADVVGDPELCATLTATGQMLGTPQYMSYEQAQGQSDIDARSDVWALGVILYEMLAGARPFEAPNTNAVLAAIRRSSAKPLHEVTQDVPAAVIAIVDRCMSPQREERFADAEALASALEVAIQRPDVLKPAAAKPQGSRFVLAVSAGVVAALVAIVAFTRKPEERVPSVSGEASVNVNHVQRQADVSRVATPPTPSTSASVATTTSAPIDAPTSAPKASVAKRKGAPITRVDEAGF